jgi:O-antigen/teichoic acid export membrane protein
LTVDAYGMLEVLNITSTLMLLFMQMGMGSAVFRSVLYQPNRDHHSVIATAFYFLLLSAVIQTCVLFFFSKEIAEFLFNRADTVHCIRLIVLITFFNAFAVIPMAVLRISHRSIQYSIFSIGGFLLEICLNVVLLKFMNLGLQGILAAMLIKSIVIALLYLSIIRNSLKSRFSGTDLKDMLAFGGPQMPAAIFFTVMNLSDRYFLNFYSDLKQIGIYSFGVRIGMVVALVVNSFQTAWPATLFSIAKDENAKKQYSIIFTGYYSFVVFIGLIINLFSREIISIIGTKEYLQSIKIIPFITTSYLFMGIYYMTSVGLQIKRKTIYEPFIMFLPMVTNVILNQQLIPKYGITGAAISHTLSFTLLGILSWYVSNRFFSIKYSYKKLILIGFAAATFCWIGYNMEFPRIMTAMLLKAILVLVFVAMIYVLKVNPAKIFSRTGR